MVPVLLQGEAIPLLALHILVVAVAVWVRHLRALEPWAGVEAWAAFSTRRNCAVVSGVAIALTTATAILRTGWRNCASLRPGGKSLWRLRSFLPRPASLVEPGAPALPLDRRTLKCGSTRHALARNTLAKGIAPMGRSATFCTTNRVCLVLCEKPERRLWLRILVVVSSPFLPELKPHSLLPTTITSRRQAQAAAPRLQVQHLQMLALPIGKLGCVTNGKLQDIVRLERNAILLTGRMSCKGTEEGCQIQICLLFLTRNQEVQLHETRLRCLGSKDIKAELLLRGLARREIPPGEVQMTFRQFMETGGARMTTGSPGDQARAMKALNWKLMYGERRRDAHLFRPPFCQPQEQFHFSGAQIAWSIPGRLLSLINGCVRISEQDEALQPEHGWRIELRELLFRPICTQLVSDIP